MSLPDFLVVGAARAGTTSLHYYLRQHPGIFLPSQKEPSFFCFADKKIDYKNGRFVFAVTDFIRYKKLYKNADSDLVKGDISTPYLYLHDETIRNIKKYHPHPDALKIVIVLRNPVERAYSQYLWKVRDGREDRSFEEALKAEKARMAQNYSFDYFYAHRGLYFSQVEDYIKHFKSVKIIFFDSFRNEFEVTMKNLCEFLGVDKDFEFTKRDKINSSSIPRFASLGRMMTVESKVKFKILSVLSDGMRMSIKESFNKFNSTCKTPEPIGESTVKWLNDFYREDIQKLQSLINSNLSHWIEP